MYSSSLDLTTSFLPPARLIKDGSNSIQSYIETGRHFFQLFERYVPLQPNMKILEMGSCIGRISRQFLPFLKEGGEFTGIDVLAEQVAWCQENIGGAFPHFRFLHADIFNTEYNPAGTIKASEYRFPFLDNSLDLIILTSVFTHMLRHDVNHYLAEIARTLKPEGLCFATFYLFTREEFPRIFTEEASPRFLFPVYRKGPLPLVICANEEDLEEAVAYETAFMDKMLETAGLAIQTKLPGKWLEYRENTYSWQDALVLRK